MYKPVTIRATLFPPACSLHIHTLCLMQCNGDFNEEEKGSVISPAAGTQDMKVY